MKPFDHVGGLPDGFTRVVVGRVIDGEWVWSWTGVVDGGFSMTPEQQLRAGLTALDRKETEHGRTTATTPN